MVHACIRTVDEPERVRGVSLPRTEPTIYTTRDVAILSLRTLIQFSLVWFQLAFLLVSSCGMYKRWTLPCAGSFAIVYVRARACHLSVFFTVNGAVKRDA